MGCIDESDHMTCSYSISRHNWKWTKNLFFHLLEFWTVLFPSCIVNQNYHIEISDLVRDLIQEGEGALTTDDPTGKTIQLTRLDKTNWTLTIREKMNLVLLVFHEKQGSVDKFQVFKMQHGVVCWSLLQGICLSLCWGKRNVKHKYCNCTITCRLPTALWLGNMTTASIPCQPLCQPESSS
jgi:hypothetical protein